MQGVITDSQFLNEIFQIPNDSMSLLYKGLYLNQLHESQTINQHKLKQYLTILIFSAKHLKPKMISMYEHFTSILITHMLHLEMMSYATKHQSNFLDYVKWCHDFKDILKQAQKKWHSKYPINIQS